MQITPTFVLLACLASLKSVAALPVNDVTLSRRSTTNEIDAREMNELQERAKFTALNSLLQTKIQTMAAGAAAAENSAKLLNDAIHMRQPSRREYDEVLETRELEELERRIVMADLASALKMMGPAMRPVGTGALAARVPNNQAQGVAPISARSFDELEARALDLKSVESNIASLVDAQHKIAGLASAGITPIVISQGPKQRALEFDELDARDLGELEELAARALEELDTRESNELETRQFASLGRTAGKLFGKLIGKTIDAPKTTFVTPAAAHVNPTNTGAGVLISREYMSAAGLDGLD